MSPHHSPPDRQARVLHWIVLAFVPSGLMLATTTFLTTDIVAMPMLWVLPLGLYLLSFSVAFARTAPRLPICSPKFAPIIVLLFGAALIAGHQQHRLSQRIDRPRPAVRRRQWRCIRACTGCDPRPTG